MDGLRARNGIASGVLRHGRSSASSLTRGGLGIFVSIILLLGLALPAGPLPATAAPVSMSASRADPLFPPPLVAASVSSGSSYFYVGAQASTTICNPTCTHVTNAGAQTTIQVVSQTVVGCLSYWLGDDSAANLWGQVGYYICNGATPVAFYQIWNLTSGAALTTGTTTVSAGDHTFSMYSQSGSTTWAFALDGTVFGTYDMGASLSLGTYPVQAASEEGLVSGPWNPAQVTFGTAMQTFLTASTNPVGSGWSPVSSAFEPWGGCASSGAVNSTGGYTCWGIAGNAQDSTVPADSLVVGGSRAAIAAGGNLWNGVPSDFTLSASPTSMTVNAGATALSTITVSASGGFTGTVGLASSVSPASGLTCGLSPSSVTGGSGTSTLSCSGSSGTYTVTVTGTSGSLSHAATVTITISDFTIAASPTSLSFTAGGSGTSTVTVSSINSFSGTVGLSASLSPATGLTCSLSPTSVSASGTSTLSCSGSAAATYTVTVTGTSGSLSHSTAVTVTVAGGPVLTLSYAVMGGGSGYSAPTLTYAQGGATKTATLSTSPMTFTVDANSGWSVTNPLAGSSSSERWQSPQAASGTATASVTIVFTYYHQDAVSFAYSVVGGGSGYTSPTVAYASFGSAASTATGSSVWADVGRSYAYPSALGGSSSTEAWRTNSGSGTVAAAGTLSVTYYHQFLVTFGYTVSGGGSGYSAPTVAATQFGLGVSVANAAATWVDSGSAYTFTNPLSGSSASERWIAASNTGTVAASGTIGVTYVHQFDASFGFTVQGGGSGYTAPTASYVSMGASATTPTGVAVWADAGTTYSLTNPLAGSGSTESWRASPATGSVAGSGTLSTVYYHQFLVTFVVQVVNGGSLPASATLTSTVFGATTSIAASGSSWVDANGAYSYPGSFAGATGERWASAGAPTGVVTQSTTITASYYHQFSVTFAYTVLGGATGSTAPLVAYHAFGTGLNVSAGGTTWTDAGSSFAYPASLVGSSSSQRWLTSSPAGIVAGTGTVTVTYIHQFWADFTYVVKGGGSGYSAPSVTYSNLSTPRTVLAVTVWVWADAGTTYQYQNPLPGSTSSNSWQTNNGVGTTGSSSTYSATYKHQYKVKFQTTTLSGTSTSISPLINVTVFGTNLSLAADNVTWVDAGSAYAFPGIFYGPLPGERWITWTAATGLVLGPMNITAAYAHEYYLAIQVNAPDGGTVAGSPGWYNATTSLTLHAAADPGWTFQEWIGGGSGSYSGTAAAAPVVLNGPVTETAVFDVGITLTASSGGSLEYAYGGTNGWVPAGSSATLYLTPGTNVTIHAAPSLFYQLDGWNGATGSGSTLVLTADAPHTLSATFGLSLYQRPDSLLGLAVVAFLVVGLAASLRRHRRKKKERALRMARVRARVRA